MNVQSNRPPDAAIKPAASDGDAQFAALIEFSEDPVISKTPEGVITGWNAAAEKMFGYTATEIIGKSVLTLIPPDRAFELRQILARVARGESVDEFETIRVRKDGKPISVGVSVAPVKDRLGRIVGVSSIVRAVTERKRAVEELRLSEARYRRLFETAPDGILVLDAETGQVVDANPFMQVLLGYSLEEFVGKKLWEIGPFKGIEASKTVFAELQLKDSVRYESLSLEKQDGGRVEAEFITNAYFAANRRLIQCNIRDITERNRAVESLRVTEARYRRLFETAQDGILILDATSGQVVDANPFMQVLLGYSLEEFLGKKLWEVGPFKGIEASKTVFAELQVKDSVRYESLSLERKDGGRVEAEFITNAYVAANRRLIQCNIRDITERRRGEESLRLSEARYRRLFETAQDGIVIIDAVTGQVVDANPFMRALLGYSPEEFVGRKLWEIGPFKSIEASKTVFAELQLKDSVRYESLSLERKDGRRVEAEFISNAYVAANRRLIQCNIRDITERRHLEKMAEEKIAELARSNAELAQFGYVASHDLQEPLRAVASCVQLLQKRYGGKLDARADEFIAHSVAGIKRMETLINDLLAYSRIASQAQPLVQTNVATVLTNVLANLAVAISESGAVVTHDAMPVVEADPTQLAQVFQNLIGNAIKFRGQIAPVIHVSAELRDGELTLSVTDNGIGIEPQYYERIFQVFQRLHTRKEYQGTGIGLAVCKKIVERHRGRIWIESQPGQGSSFRFTLPTRNT